MNDTACRRAPATCRTSRFRRARVEDDGLSIVELVMALSVFAILSTGVVATMMTALDMTRTNRHRVVAANVAAEEMDRLRSLASTSFTSLEPGVPYTPVNPVLNGTRYTVTVDRSWLESSATQDPCKETDGSEFTPRFISVTVTVKWPDMGGIKPVRSDTVIVPPVNTFDSASLGNVAVLVTDRDGDPLVGEPVSLTAPDASVSSATTTDEGCAVFNLLEPGDYAVRLQKVGWVDNSGQPDALRSVGVQPGRITTLEITYDQSVTLTLSLSGGSGYPVPDGMWATIANPNLPTSTQAVPGPGQTGATRTVTDLFPFMDGYSAWGGRCVDAQPTGLTPVAPDPGATGIVSVAMAAVEITVQKPEGGGYVPAAGIAVTAIHDPADGCPTGVSYALGNTDGSGVLRAAVPKGLLRFEIPDYAVDGYPELQLAIGAVSTATIRIGTAPPPEGVAP